MLGRALPAYPHSIHVSSLQGGPWRGSLHLFPISLLPCEPSGFTLSPPRPPVCEGRPDRRQL